nr:MAG TPA: hypothetical protein [Caudoviricetes sp.]
MVSAILNAAMGMMGVFAFLMCLVLSLYVLILILFFIYCVIAELYKWIKSKFD